MSRLLPFALALSFAFFQPAAGAEFMFRATVDGETIEGKPLDWSDTAMTLLGRDGQLHVFDHRTVKNAQKTAPEFRAYSDAEMRKVLYEEFDGRFDFTSTGHYLVVHPKGERSAWAQRFEQIYRAFTTYVRVRGFPVRKPEFPLVAIVLRNRAEFEKHVTGSRDYLPPNTLGFYRYSTNRVWLFDITEGDESRDWSTNASTIIHEATHQMAFNLGVHSRTSPPPRWIPEGLATMFEARGVWRPSPSDRRSDRINQDELRVFRQRSKGDKPPFSLREFVASDNPFKSDTLAAYAQAWALSFYLSETRPREYCAHLAATADRPVYSDFSAGERLALFQEAFGDNLDVLEANFMRWMEAL